MRLREALAILLATSVAAAVLGGARTARAQESATSSEPAPVPEPHGILPLEDYDADLWTREHLLGDSWGARSRLAEKGLSFSIDYTQVVQSVVHGGLRERTKYGGSVDYLANLDLDRMSLVPGGLIRFRAESRYGNSVNGDSGAVSPVNMDGLVPLTRELDTDIPITVTDLNYTQFLSQHFGVLAGKIDTLDGADADEIAAVTSRIRERDDERLQRELVGGRGAGRAYFSGRILQDETTSSSGDG